MIDRLLKNKTILFPVILGVLTLAGGLIVLTSPAKKYLTLKHELAKVRQSGYTPVSLDRLQQQGRQLETDVSAVRSRLTQMGIGPRSEIIPAFVRHVEILAREERVALGGVTPGVPVEGSPLTQIPFQMAISGPYLSVERFLDRMEHSRPPVHVQSMTLAQGSDGRLDLSLTGTLFSVEGPETIDRSEGTPTVMFRSEPIPYADLPPGNRRDIFSFASYRMDKAEPIKKGPSRQEARLNSLGTPHVTGIFFDGSRSLALVDGISLHLGDAFRGYTVVAIEKDRITLENEGRRVNVILKDE